MNPWRGEQGKAWAERNPADVAGTDASWRMRYGISKSLFMREFLRPVPLTDWLEVGCATGAHMKSMEDAGQCCRVGVDLNTSALRSGKRVAVADACALPFRARAFGGVTTSGTLMHVGPPERLRDALVEMTRVAREWLLCLEVHRPGPTVVDYADLMPTAWVYPWRDVLPVMLEGWKLVDAVCLYGLEPKHGALDVVLMRRT